MTMNVKQDNREKDQRETLTDKQVKTYIKNSQEGDKQARDILVERNVRLVWSVVQRFLNRGYDPDDLFQIGSIGLIKAIDKFDLFYDVRFSTYALPMIIGGIQIYFLDDGTVKVSRSLKEMGNTIRKKKDERTEQYGVSPTVNDIERKLDITVEEVVIAEEAIKSPQSIYLTVFEND